MRHFRIIPRTAAVGLMVLFAVVACEDGVVEPDAVTFTVEVSGETFRIRTSDPETIAGLEARRLGGVRGVINGALVSGDGGFNDPWSWHMDPADVTVPDLAIEVCDGRPSMVEADQAYWLGTVGRFCPWGALVTGRSD